MNRRKAAAGLAGLWVLFALLAGVSEGVRRTRTGDWLRYWKKARLTNVTHETGAAYLGSVGRSDLSSHEGPSPARVLENGVLRSPGNDQHDHIREIGQGRFSFWHDVVYFSASDNSDPRNNGRVYKVHYPLIGARTAGAVYAVTALVLALALVASGVALGRGTLGPRPLQWVRTHGAAVLVGLSAASLVAVAALRAAPGARDAVDVAWPWVIGLNVVTTLAVRRRYGAALPAGVTASFVVALTASYGFLTLLAPHRPQGCHTTEPVAAWDLFCVAPDSASYYAGYFPGSTRNPLYPWFIQAVTLGTGFEPKAYMPTHTEGGRPITDAADPLFRVVRVQIALLLAASLVACFSMMRLLGSPLPAALFLWLYDNLFFTAYELNVVLTEDLVQAWLFLLVASFLAFLRSPRPWLLHAAAASCGLMYLTRQAAAFGLVFFGTMVLWALAASWRRWWRPCVAACATLLALFSVPDVHGALKSGSLGKQQDSLQFQYRIAHAMQYAQTEDIELMPDEASRRWLRDAIARRDAEHRKVHEAYKTEYDRRVAYVAVNLYFVATPPGSRESPRFLMAVANPVLARHWDEYLAFGFRFWQLGVGLVPLARITVAGLSPWVIYAVLGLLMLWLRDRHALAAAACVTAHWLHVAIASFFAAPLARMVWATDVLVVLAAALLLWRAAERLGAWLQKAGPRR